MQILATPGWDGYQLLDTGDGYRLEQFGKYIVSRPDPQIIWKKSLSEKEWQKADAVFERTSEDKGKWVKKNPKMPEKWLMQYQNLSFYAQLAPFKHTGIFPEQHLQWDWMISKIEDRKSKIEKEVNILNLFAYTGIASLAASDAGAKVTHVDASRPTIGWAKENQQASHLSENSIRWILDDCLKFVGREIKRGVKYDGIIMDPPAFGHGPDGSIWKFNDSFPKLLEMCTKLLSDNPLFVVVNAYAISSSSIMLQNVLEDQLKSFGGKIESGELVLEQANHRQLSTGLFARWSA